jgi:hypothetical protein
MRRKKNHKIRKSVEGKMRNKIFRKNVFDIVSLNKKTLNVQGSFV